MIIAIPTNDRQTIAVHTGRCKEFALFEIENGKLVSQNFETNTYFHENDKGCCGRHSGEYHQHNHDDIVTIISKADKLLYYAMGKRLRNELTEKNIHFEKAKYIYLDEILNDFYK